MTQAQPPVASYDYAAFQADRAIMRYRAKKAQPTEDGLLLKRQLLAGKADAEEMQAIDAAFHRLMAWTRSGAPVPNETVHCTPSAAVPQPKRADGEEGQGGAGEEATTATAEEARIMDEMNQAWAVELAKQQARHDRRRSKYEAVRPEPLV